MQGDVMFSRPIVFVVGAGASKEFGLPDGYHLSTNIAKSLDFDRRGAVGAGDRGLFDMIGMRFKEQSGEYLQAAAALVDRLPKFPSIDEALHWYSSSPQIIELGRAAIVYEVLAAERNSKLYDSVTSPIIKPHSYEDAWLSFFLTMAMGGVKREEAQTAFENVTMINFNYDRTVEYFLFSKLQTDFDLTEKEAAASISSLHMIRPYGSVGPLQFQHAEGAVPFGAQIGVNHDQLFSLATNISTYTETQAGSATKAAIQHSVDTAGLFVILGFGFHEQNLQLLTGRAPSIRRHLVATAVNVDQHNFGALKTRLGHVFRCSDIDKIQLINFDAYNLLRTLKPTLISAL
jgi:hypothetical protein